MTGPSKHLYDSFLLQKRRDMLYAPLHMFLLIYPTSFLSNRRPLCHSHANSPCQSVSSEEAVQKTPQLCHYYVTTTYY